MKTRKINIKRLVPTVNEKGETILKPTMFRVRINNEIPPKHRLCENNKLW